MNNLSNFHLKDIKDFMKACNLPSGQLVTRLKKDVKL